MYSKPKAINTTLRIIGGRLRGRQLVVPVRPGLRPTHDRIRETLFNWLKPMILDSFCLDAFAGSGALGFEALSRGAQHVVFVENDRDQAKGIEKNAKLLELNNHQVIQSTWPGVRLLAGRFDLVFLDPPFHSGLIDVVWNELIHEDQLSPHCWIYIEHGVNEQPVIPNHFICHRQKRTKQVVCGLYTRSLCDGATLIRTRRVN
jgi:16S rRNA (guanine966-N2)-methyltransferase